MRYQPDYIKFALPKGRFLLPTANLLKEAALGFNNYHGGTRHYRLQSEKFSHLSAKIFQEKDIPIQVAIGNYDLGICGLDWVEELLVRYPASALAKISSLNYGEGDVYLVTSRQGEIYCLDELLTRRKNWRIVSEYPNLAQSLALDLRLRGFRIFPVWGATDVYPPENADLGVLWARDESEMRTRGLLPLIKLLPTTAFLIANRESLANKDLSQILDCFNPGLGLNSLSGKGWRRDDILSSSSHAVRLAEFNARGKVVSVDSRWQAKEIKLALPDGHQQPPTLQFLKRAGLNTTEYTARTLNRRPSSNLDWLGIKVIRPQDMPLQVANGSFDLAITGRDWLQEHLSCFPLSPVKELFSLGFGTVKIVAAVNQDMPADSIDDLRALIRGGRFTPLRVASEYINLADKYLRDNYVNPYKLIPTWGASEAFLPEDADLLIDNSQTGETLVQHHLKVIDVLFESTACLIGNKDSLNSRDKKERIDFLTKLFRRGLP